VRIAHPEHEARARRCQWAPLTVADVLTQRIERGAVRGAGYSHVVTSDSGRRVGLAAASADRPTGSTAIGVIGFATPMASRTASSSKAPIQHEASPRSTAASRIVWTAADVSWIAYRRSPRSP
jgi:hypothetical protein